MEKGRSIAGGKDQMLGWCMNGEESEGLSS